jgi:DNA-binding MarR family transcriptional regulator
MSKPNPAPGTEPRDVDSSFLRTLVGYNTRRATLKILDLFMARMAEHGLKPVEFSVLSLIGRNPGLTSRQLCRELNLLPPNLARLLARLDQRQLIERTVQAADKRAQGLTLSPSGARLLAKAEATALQLETDATAALTANQRDTLIRLLQRIYL